MDNQNLQAMQLPPAALPTAEPMLPNSDNKMPCLTYVDCGASQRYMSNSSSCGQIMLSLLLIFGFMMLIWHISTMDCVSSFFTPPETTMMNELKNIPVTTVPSLNQNDLAKQMMETFNNDLPNQTNPIPTDDTNYSDVAADMALEKSVKDQHRKYVNQREKYTGTASFNPERSDAQDIVTFVGLRRPSYLTKEGKSLEDPTARQVATVIDPKDLSKPVNLSWNYGSFT
jgi:hypothetical protein